MRGRGIARCLVMATRMFDETPVEGNWELHHYDDGKYGL